MGEQRVPATSARVRRDVAPVLAVALTVLVAHFARVSQLGLYEDDYWAIAPHLHEPLGRLWPTLAWAFREWPTGRPLNHFLPVALSAIGSSLGGLAGVYALAAAWLTLNGVLVFLAVRRLASAEAALVAALAYLVFPADSTKILLTHAAHVQGAMTFLLAAVWLWLRRGRWRAGSYPVAALALLAYETAFLPFLAMPILEAHDRRAAIRTWTIHALCCAAIVAAVAAIRLSAGDPRAAGAFRRPRDAAYRAATSLYIGPRTSGPMLVRAAGRGWRSADAAAALAAAVAVAGFAAALLALRPRRRPAAEVPAAEPAGDPAAGEQPSGGGRPPWPRLLAAAALAWPASYALTLVNYPPVQTVGRLTSTHVAAAWPVSLAVAAAYEAARRRGPRAGRMAAAVFAAWLGSMVAYHQHLQREYARAWEAQKGFWSQVMALAPEAGPGWTVIVGGAPADTSPVILGNSWADYHAYGLIFAPRLDAGPAFAHLGSMGVEIPFRRAGDRVEWQPRFWGGPFEPIDPARLVLLHDDRGALRRIPELSTPGGKLAAPSVPVAPARASVPETPVSRLLFPERFP